jgi:hypothetical protein
MDEEPFSPNNPRGYMGDIGTYGFRKGIQSGESAQREVIINHFFNYLANCILY